jgi:capsular exopolysaccharide synthesis family protein
VEKAELPTLRDEYRRHKLSGGAGAAALVGIVLGVSFLEFRARRVSSVDQIVQGLGMNLVGALPALPARPRSRRSLEGSDDALAWRNILVESVDAARTAILHASRAESIRVVMITSAQGGEGKTSLACHLALSLARAGRKTLLVDCDLRNPSAHTLFEVSPAPGLSELLRGGDEVTPAAAVHATPNEGLHLMPAGECDDRVLQSLARDDVGHLFRQLKGDYDFVVVDTAPVLPVADSLLLSQHVDAVLFSVLNGVSRVPKVYEASSRLTALGARVLGAVVMGVRGELGAPDRTYYPRRDSGPSKPLGGGGR